MCERNAGAPVHRGCYVCGIGHECKFLSHVNKRSHYIYTRRTRFGARRPAICVIMRKLHDNPSDDDTSLRALGGRSTRTYKDEYCIWNIYIYILCARHKAQVSKCPRCLVWNINDIDIYAFAWKCNYNRAKPTNIYKKRQIDTSIYEYICYICIYKPSESGGTFSDCAVEWCNMFTEIRWDAFILEI